MTYIMDGWYVDHKGNSQRPQHKANELHLKEPSPIFATFFQTFEDFGITRKLVYSHNPWQIYSSKVFSLEDITEKVTKLW